MGNRKYESPLINVNRFTANEFVAACNPPYSAVCGVGNKRGVLFEDTNGNKKLDNGDRAVNKLNNSNNLGFNEYKACGAPHDVTHEQYSKMTLGFLVGTNTVNNAKGWFWDWGDENLKRTNFNYDVLNNDATPVWIWNHDYNSAQRGWHATPVEGGITTNHS